MAQYSHHVNNFHRSQVAKRFKWLSIFVIIVSVLGGAVIGVDWLLNRLSNSNTVVSTETTTSVQSASISIYRTPYFQFQAPDDWVAVAEQGSDKRFVFIKKGKDNSVPQRLIVFVDRPLSDSEADMALTNTVAVNVNESGGLSDISEVSKHCKESWPKDLPRTGTRIKHGHTSMVCNPDSFEYNVVVGTYEGNEIISMTRPDGSIVKLTVIFSNLTAYPGSGDLISILSSFTVL